MNYEKISGFFKSSNGVNNTAYYIYVPTAAKIKGVVQIVHGMFEICHIARLLLFLKG